jgi:ubiquinone/menaquinone biosynthesis C-methylase UbiE
MKRWFLRTTHEERAFEKKGVLALMDKYLATDVIEKVGRDDGYRAKVRLLEDKVGQCDGFILDVGSNTAGECEYMVSRGYSIIATDINEYALSISQKRCAHFSRKAPAYVACDGVGLPFVTGSMACVVFNESLHHMPDPLASIKEAWRVLRPGGRILMFEPYAYDPWRRISEIRDYFRGTIETSFSEGHIKRMLSESGFSRSEMSRPVLPPSRDKLATLPAYPRSWG